MMKCLVLQTFIDKESGKGYYEGDTYESSDSKRVAFLVKEGFLGKPPNKAQEKKETAKNTKESEQKSSN
ncbi:hypothetical protein BTO30_12440 [Domibacillus antri]|uniref:Uncharacterized protein n=1 Tax=Domibacillus antri TaxID=1714264 RepID=A0A1Q8Q3H8_9BACI|nr:hypothetical protein [Domibacillus antri]OLN21900.1 hypothetical protein BTO30_12440 [Domibacillus antri]